MTPRRAPTWARRVAIALLLVAFALRVYLLSEADIWWDEGLAVWAVRQGLAAAVRWTAGDVHPPLFFAALWAWLGVAGDSAFALRLGVALVGLVVTALAWPLGRRLGGPWGGALAVAAVGTSRFLVWWSMELRMYTLAAAGVMGATLGAVRWLDGRRRRDLALYVGGATAAVYTVYLAGAALLALNVVVGWVLVGRGVIGRRRAMVGPGPKALTPRPPPSPHRAEGAAGTPWDSLGEGESGWRDVVEWSAAQVAVLAAFAPWAIYASARMSSWRVVVEGPSVWFTAKLWLTLLATGVSTDIDKVTPWVIAFTAALILALAIATTLTHRQRGLPPRLRDLPLPQTWGRGSGGEGLRPWRPQRPPSDVPAASLLLALLVIPPLCTWAITQPRSLFYSPHLEARYFVPFAAPALAVAAALIARFAGRRRDAWALVAPGLACLLIAPSLRHLPAYYAPRRATDTLPTMALAIWSEAEPGDVVLLVSGNRYPLWLYHYDRAWVQPLGTPRYEFPADAPPRWEDRPPVVLFPDRGSDPLSAHADWQPKLDGIVDNHKRVWLVEYGRDLQDPKDEVEARLAERMTRVLSEGYGADALHLFAKDGRGPVVTGLSARWPGTVALRGAKPMFEPQGRAGQEGHPLAGAPARRAAVGDTVNVTLFGSPIAFGGDVVSSAALRDGATVVGWFDGGLGAGDFAWLEKNHRLRLFTTIDRRSVGGRLALHVEVRNSMPILVFDRALTVLDRPPRPGRVTTTPIGRFRTADWPLEDPRTRAAPLPAPFLRLAACDVYPQRAAPGEDVIVDLEWEGIVPSRDIVVFAHLVGPPRPDGSGAVWAGEDGPPSSGSWTSATFDRHVLTIDPAAPRGNYQVEVGLYDVRSGDRLVPDGPSATADVTNRRLLVGHVTVR